MTEHVIVTDADGIRTIRMNRPDKKNALTLAMYEAMTAALEGANADDSVHCVLIAGVPGAFSAGNDLADFLKAAQSTGGLSRPALHFLPALVRCNKGFTPYTSIQIWAELKRQNLIEQNAPTPTIFDNRVQVIRGRGT